MLRFSFLESSLSVVHYTIRQARLQKGEYRTVKQSRHETYLRIIIYGSDRRSVKMRGWGRNIEKVEFRLHWSSPASYRAHTAQTPTHSPCLLTPHSGGTKCPILSILYFYIWKKKKKNYIALVYSQLTMVINSVVIVSGGQQRDSAIHLHASILPRSLLPSRLPCTIEQSSLCYTVRPCWLSILNIAALYFCILNYLSLGLCLWTFLSLIAPETDNDVYIASALF